MTNGEAVSLLMNSQYYSRGYKQGVSDVLDKIRAEIIARNKNVKAVRSDSCCFFTAEEVIKIIDKHKAESEK